MLMNLEKRIAQIVAQDCLTPTERAATILIQPEIATGLAMFAIHQEMQRTLARFRQANPVIVERSRHGRRPPAYSPHEPHP